MGGGLMQLVAYGAQDIYLTGNPQITFFKVVYRRHTNFSMECIQQTVAGTSTLTGSTTSGDVIISRNGDLVSGIYVTSSSPDITDGSSLIDSVDLEIGGQLIDRHFKEWNQVWQELTTPAAKQDGLKFMQNSFTHSHTQTGQINSIGMVQIPLYFWFCRNPGLALPLIALQYHEVKLKFTWGTSASSSVGTTANCKVWADYIYLDTDERRRFAQVSHEYLIDQLQKDSFAGDKKTFNLNFNHPVKELIWTSAAANAYVDAKLVLNGHDRFEPQEEEYFQLRQPYQYHTNVPGYNIIYHEGNALSSTVVDTGVRQKHDTPTATKATIAVGTSITFHADTSVIPEIGDQLSIMSTRGTDHRGSKSTVTAKSSDPNPVLTVSPAIHADHLPDSFADDDELHIFIYGGHRTPLPNVSNLEKKINVYSFSLKPEEHQPSGTCNFSRIDTAQLIFNTVNGEAFNIYAVNYNVLRIMSGMGGLAYSN